MKVVVWARHREMTTLDEKQQTSHALPFLKFSIKIRQWPLHVFVFTLYTLTSVCTFSKLFSVHSKDADEENFFNNQELL